MGLKPDDLMGNSDPFKVELSKEHAIRIIQKNERGRLGICRALLVATWRSQKRDGRGGAGGGAAGAGGGAGRGAGVDGDERALAQTSSVC